MFLKNKKGKVFGFGVLLVLIYFLAVYLIPGVVNLGDPNGLVKSFQEEVPDFELKDGTLWVEEAFEVNTATSFVKVNTDPGFLFDDAGAMVQYFSGYRQVILMDSKKAIVLKF